MKGLGLGLDEGEGSSRERESVFGMADLMVSFWGVGGGNAYFTCDIEKVVTRIFGRYEF